MKVLYKKISAGSGKWIVRGLLMALVPLVWCLIYCGVQGYGIGDVYLPGSEWNDELFYFKQVEAILEYGYPIGYFGFNESHAAYLSFAAWSPVLVIPWVLWGTLFGWNMLSPIWCNLFIMSAALFGYVLLTKPEKKQMGILAVLYCAFPLFTRYILSGMPEIICFSLAIVFYGVAVSYLKDKATGGKLAWMFGLSVVLTLMRPYLLLLMFLPIVLWIYKCRKWWSVAGSLGIMGATFGIYVLIHTLLGAEYLEPLYSVEWLDVMLEDGLFAGIKFILYMIWHRGGEFVRAVIEAFRTGYVMGAFFAVFVAVAVIFVIQLVQAIRRKDKTEGILAGHMAFSCLGMLAALLLMYGLYDGRRHLMTFVAVGIFLISIMRTKYFVKAAVIGVMCLYLFTIKGDSPYDYQVPFVQQETVEEMQYWADVFEKEIQLDHTNVPNYNNVVIWVLTDTIEGENAPVSTRWQPLYNLPKGMGISCCFSSYVNENMDQLKSRYIAAPAGGSVDKHCRESGLEELGRKGELAFYRVR